MSEEYQLVHFLDSDGSNEQGLLKHVDKESNVGYVIFGEICMNNPNHSTAVPVDLDSLYIRENVNLIPLKTKI